MSEQSISQRGISQHGNDLAAVEVDMPALLADGKATGRWVLDPARSRAEFAAKHFWGAVTVRGVIGRVTGEGNVGADGTITGQLTIDARSLNTKNKQRDKHLRSADFFHVDRHPNVVVTVTQATPAGRGSLACSATLEAAGHVQPVEFTARIEEANASEVVLSAELVIDRTAFDMTWSPLGMASSAAQVVVVARFVRP